MRLNGFKLMVWILAALFFASGTCFCWYGIHEMREANELTLRRYRVELETYGILKEVSEATRAAVNCGGLPLPKPLKDFDAVK